MRHAEQAFLQMLVGGLRVLGVLAARLLEERVGVFLRDGKYPDFLGPAR
jgi:hypothetical protein